MIPDINVVRGRNKKNKKSSSETNELRIEVIRHFSDELIADINRQLNSGDPATCKLDYWAIRGYMQNELNIKQLTDHECFRLLDAIFNRIEILYTCAGYITFVDKCIGAQSNYNAYYASYYRCDIGF